MAYISVKDKSSKCNISPKSLSEFCLDEKISGLEMLRNTSLTSINVAELINESNLKYSLDKKLVIKPFVKWAGGKGQLLSEIRTKYPEGMGTNITKYAEPFVGGGAVLFDILNISNMEELYISDINSELINTYRMIKYEVSSTVDMLKQIQNKYINLDTENRKGYYYGKRDRFNYLKVNGNKDENIEKAALFIFLNKTCFNGLYRVNSKGLFNVPIGSYKNPLICAENNLNKISEALQKVTIVCGDYRKSAEFIDDKTFVYFDPPYRPLTNTSNFTSYTETLFNDAAQKELSKFVSLMTRRGAKILVSNSDPKNSDVCDDFFDILYSEHNIERVEASRMINCNSEMRGKISELLISNYER